MFDWLKPIVDPIKGIADFLGGIWDALTSKYPEDPVIRDSIDKTTKIEDADMIGYTKAKSEGFTAKKNDKLVATPTKKMNLGGNGGCLPIPDERTKGSRTTSECRIIPLAVTHQTWRMP